MRYGPSVSSPGPGSSAGPADERAAFLDDLLARAGQAAIARFRDGTTRLKADGTQVTDGDMASHDVLVEGLSKAFPGELVNSEEGPHEEDPAPGQAVWHVDPIDGTGAFADGLAHWGPTVVRVVDEHLDVGAFHMPRVGERYFAATGQGAWFNDRRLEFKEDPSAAIPARLQTLYLPSRAHRYFPIAWPGKMRALGASAAHLCLVANGTATATLIPVWSMWDVGLGIMMVREAGRAVVDLTGAPFDPVRRIAEPFVAAAPSVVPGLLEGLRAAREAHTRS